MVKVCGMYDPRNIGVIAAAGPDLMGFIFYEGSPRYAGGLAPGSLDALPPNIKRVGVFVDAPEEGIRRMAALYRLDFVQLHGGETPEMCRRLLTDFGVIKAFGIADAADLEKTARYEGACDLYVFDTKTAAHGGSGRKFDHDVLSGYRGNTPYLLSGGLGPDDAETLAGFADERCAGFDINSRFETAAGLKEAKAVRKFIETIKNTQK